MLSKQRLVELLEECIEMEKDAVPLYSCHLSSPDFFQDLLPGDQERVKKALNDLAENSRSHQGIFESLLAKIKEAPHNAS